MFTFLPSRLFVKCFPYVAKCMARRREASYAQQKVRRLQARYVRIELEDLEERITPNAYTFAVDGVPSVGAWSNNNLWSGGIVPVAGDTATIPNGATCTVAAAAGCQSVTVAAGGTLNINQNLSLSSSQGLGGGLSIATGGTVAVGANGTLAANSLSDSGSLVDQGTVNVATDGYPGSGSTSVATTGATLTIGSSNSSATPSFVTNSLTDIGTITVGSSSASGAAASLDAVFADIHTGILNIGDPGSGTAGTVDISKTMSLSGGTLNVGGAGGSGGTLGAYVLTASQASIVNVNEHGQMNIEDSATLGGTTTVSGGVITAENIDAFNGAGITISGTADVTSGPLLGNLVAGANASFTFAPFSTVTLGTGATLGNGQFYIDGTLNVNEDLEATLSEFTVQDSAALIDGSGSIDWWNQPFNWEGGTIGGLSGGGFPIDGNSDNVDLDTLMLTAA